MRISDWSSDVCSSDLAPPVPRPGDAAALRPQLRRHSLRRLAGGHFRELPMTRRFSLLCIAAVALVLVWGGAASPLAAGPFRAHMLVPGTLMARAAPLIAIALTGGAWADSEGRRGG